jgi:hypothetical protein
MNFPTIADLERYPELIEWLKSDDWYSHFTPGQQHQSKINHVTSLKLFEEDYGTDQDEADEIDLRFDARVKGMRPHAYSTRLYVQTEHDFRSGEVEFGFFSECSCGESFDEMCDHGLTVLMKLRECVLNVRPVVNAARMSAEIAAWLDRIKDATLPPPPAKPAKPYSKFLAYCVVCRSHPYRSEVASSYYLSTHIGNRTKTGITIQSNAATADPARPAQYMATEDLAICARFHQRSRKLGLWGSSMALSGDGWEDILQPALATGRMYFCNQNERSTTKSEVQLLKAGPPLQVEPAWQALPGGGAKPILKLPSASIQILPLEPLHYLDTQSCEIGLLQSHLPSSVLLTWQHGPAMPAESIPKLNSTLSALPLANPLPLPAEKPARILKGLTPTPILQITHVHVGIYQKRHIGGLLKFQYPGSPPLFPIGEDEPAVSIWFDGEHRVILEREKAAENALAQDLANHGFIPLKDLFPALDLTDKNRHSVVITKVSNDLTEWLEFLESSASEELRNKGWIIETDSKLNLNIHELVDFFPAIETNPDHGIDWFRFDVTGEYDGKRVSLIPQIARAIAEDWPARYATPESIPATILLPCENPQDGHVRFPGPRFLEIVGQVRHLFHGNTDGGPVRLDRLSAAGVADALSIESSETTRALAALGRNLRDIHELPPAAVPATVLAELRPYQTDGFRWLQFLARHSLHGVLADDMGLGKTLQTLAHLAAEHANSPGKPSLVIAPTSVVPNWAAEAEKFIPSLKVLVLHGGDRAENFNQIPKVDLVLTSYPLLVRDFDELSGHPWHVLVLDEAQAIKNPKAISSHCACKLKAAHRICLSGTPMENHLGELWSLMRFLMPGFLADEKTFNTSIRRPIERDNSTDAQLALNRRVSPLILRRTKDQVATELPEKTIIVHNIELTGKQTDLYESVRAAMDARVREAIAEKGLAKSHIIVLDALLKLRQICCHPQLLKSEAAQRVLDSAKLEFLTNELLPTLLEEGRRILIFSQFTSMLDLIQEHLQMEKIPFLILTGQTKERANLVKKFQTGEIPVFLISLKAGGTGLNLTAADTIIHYDPWWNPAAENQATDRAHRIGQTKPVFVHKLVCRGTIEDRILDLQKKKSALVEALLSEGTGKLTIDASTLSHLLSPLS